jgi:uncharacterized metal-binding protein YceD (DUF177 family)
VTPELYRPFPLERLTGGEQVVEATAAEREAIAARLHIPGVLALRCRFDFARAGAGGTLAAHGLLQARVVQECVVSLEPFEADVTEAFSVRFVPPGLESGDDDPLSDDELVYQGGVIDLGEAAVEQLALALDPFPRRPGAALPEAEPEQEAANPFAVLGQRRSPQQ